MVVSFVALVDPSPVARAVLCEAVPETHVCSYPTVTAWLAAFPAHAGARGCLVTEAALSDGTWREVLSPVREAGLTWPVVVLAEEMTVAGAVEAMRGGASDVLSKMPEPGALRRSIVQAAARRGETVRDSGARLAALTVRERQVLDLVMQGLSSGLVAQRLGISRRTVELHRSRIKLKTHSRNVADLVVRTLTAGGGQSALFTAD